MVEDIFLLRTPSEVAWEVAREVDARWTESALRARFTNLEHWVPFASPRIHAELRLIASCNRASLNPSFDTYDPRKPAAIRIGSSHDVGALCALWVTVYNRHFGTRFKVFPAGGSGKADRNWAFVLSPRERPDQDVSELVYNLLENELRRLQDASRTSWGAILRSMTSWICLPRPDVGLVSRREPNRSSTQTYVASHISDSKVTNTPSAAAPLADTDAPVVQKSQSVATSSKYDIIRRRAARELTGYNNYEMSPLALPSQPTETCGVRAGESEV